MKLYQLPTGELRLALAGDEAAMLAQLVSQLIDLLQSHSSTTLDPDPLFASLEIGGSEHAPEDPALARLFPNAYETDSDADAFRRVTEQGLLNRKLQDALLVLSALTSGERNDHGLAAADPPSHISEETPTAVDLDADALAPWARTLTALRLAIAARIGLQHDTDHAALADDPHTRNTLVVFNWLAAILESILAIMGNAALSDDAEPDDSGHTGG